MLDQRGGNAEGERGDVVTLPLLFKVVSDADKTEDVYGVDEDDNAVVDMAVKSVMEILGSEGDLMVLLFDSTDDDNVVVETDKRSTAFLLLLSP